MTETVGARSRLLVRLCGPIGALLILGAGPAVAVAEDQAEQRARAHFHAAEQHFNDGRFRLALAGYRRAHALRPLPGLLFNIAQCYRNLGRCREAVWYYRRFIAHAPQLPFADDVRAVIARCNRQQPASPSAPVRAAPRTTLAPPGLPPGGGGPVDRRTAVGVSSPSNVGNAALSRRPASRPQVTMQRPAPDRRLFWSGAVLTGALATAATVTWAFALHRNQRYKDPTTSPTERPALRDSGEDLTLATNLLWGTTAASAVATALVYWLDGDREQPVTTAALSLDTHRLVLGVGGRF